MSKPRSDGMAGPPGDDQADPGRSHFERLNTLSESCAAQGITLFSHQYDHLAFGSWTLVAGRAHDRLRFSWDGKESRLEVEVSHFDSMNAPARWAPLPDAGLAAPAGGQATVFRHLLDCLLERDGAA